MTRNKPWQEVVKLTYAVVVSIRSPLSGGPYSLGLNDSLMKWVNLSTMEGRTFAQSNSLVIIDRRALDPVEYIGHQPRSKTTRTLFKLLMGLDLRK